MEKRPRHRPTRKYPEAKRKLFNCELNICPHCGAELKLRPNWHVRKTIQTLEGPQFIAGRAKMCMNAECLHRETRYYASQVLLLSLPKSTYGLDVLAYIGWRHEHDQRQLVEIQRELNQKGIEINERNVGKLYRQYLALLGATSEAIQKKLDVIVEKHGGLIFGVDALQPEGHGSLLYVLYEILSGTVVSAIQLEAPNEQDLTDWLKTYQKYPALASVSDGEERIIAALRAVWPNAPRQRCQEHFLGNLADEVLANDTELRKQMRADLGGLPKITDFPDSSSFFLSPTVPEEAESAKERLEIESQFRMAIRDAVNRATRKPFYWGGLKGYRQLESIAQALHTLPVTENAFFGCLIRQVDRTLENNRPLAETLDKTYTWFLRIAACLRYPPRLYMEAPAPTRQQVKQEMEELLQNFEIDARGQKIPRSLYSGLRKRWRLFGDDLLHCFEIPGLPQDNLKVESLFGRLRCHQRRISGRKSTQPLRDFGHYQILFLAESEDQLLEQLRLVPVEDYQEQRKHQALAEVPRQFLARLHRDPAKTMQNLADRYIAHLPVGQPFDLFFATPLSNKLPQYTV